MKNLDNFIEGVFDKNAPFNQPDSENEYCSDNLEDVFYDKDEDCFLNILSDIRKEVNKLREYAKNNENIYLLKRLNSIYQKL